MGTENIAYLVDVSLVHKKEPYVQDFPEEVLRTGMPMGTLLVFGRDEEEVIEKTFNSLPKIKHPLFSGYRKSYELHVRESSILDEDVYQTQHFFKNMGNC